jgi:hypothetical protein
VNDDGVYRLIQSSLHELAEEAETVNLASNALDRARAKRRTIAISTGAAAVVAGIVIGAPLAFAGTTGHGPGSGPSHSVGPQPSSSVWPQPSSSVWPQPSSSLGPPVIGWGWPQPSQSAQPTTGSSQSGPANPPSSSDSPTGQPSQSANPTVTARASTYRP